MQPRQRTRNSPVAVSSCWLRATDMRPHIGILVLKEELMPSKSAISTMLIALAVAVFSATNVVALNPQPEPPGIKYKKIRAYKHLPPNPCKGTACVRQRQKVKPMLPPGPCKGSACVAR